MLTMKSSEYFYTVKSETPTCCSCAYWVATRIYNREAFMCPNDGLGSCSATPTRSMTPPEDTCHSWQPWQTQQAPQTAAP